MREIKFRVWNYDNKKMTFIDQLNFDEDGKVIVVDAYIRKFELMQFTGLLDKNGREIYEGDIIKGYFGADAWYGEEYIEKDVIGKPEPRYGLIEFASDDIYDDNGAHEAAIATGFHIKIKNYYQGLYHNLYIQVVGNLYENPELLEQMK